MFILALQNQILTRFSVKFRKHSATAVKRKYCHSSDRTKRNEHWFN